MRILTDRGHASLFLILVLPVMLLLLVTTVRFSKIVHEKIRLQGTVDRAVYAGAAYLSEVLNQTALLNWEVHRLFRERKEEFLKNGSKKNEKEAHDQLLQTVSEQDALRAEMEDLAGAAYSRAYQIANGVFQESFPEGELELLARNQILLKEGPKEIFYFDRINGVVFDPTGHTRVDRKEFKLRMAFVKDPSSAAFFGGRAAIVREGRSLQAVAAAEPYGGSLWNFALSPDKADSLLYRTAGIPVEVFYEEDE